MKKRMRIGIIAGASLVIILIVAVVVIAALPAGAKNLDLNAKLSEIVGVVKVRNSVQDNYNPVNDGYILKIIQQLQTQQQSKVKLDLSTGTIVRLGSSTIFSLDPPASGSGGVLSRIQMQAGRIWIVLKGGSLDVNTNGGLASVRGSYMSVWMDQNTNIITVMCLEGHCSFTNLAGTVQLTSAQKIIAFYPNILPIVQMMDMSDIQSWLDNCPESAAIIPSILYLVATSTPTATLEYTPTPSGTITTTLTITPGFGTPGYGTPGFGTPGYTPNAFLTGTPVTGTPTTTPTPTRTSTPTATLPGGYPTPTRAGPRPTATRPAPTQPPPTPVPTRPAPTATPNPYP